LTHRLGNVFNAIEGVYGILENLHKFVMAIRSRGWFLFIPHNSPESTCQKTGAGLIHGGKFCRRFHQVGGMPRLAALGAVNSIRQRIGNAGAAMIG
jgi:hypothetical protein